MNTENHIQYIALQLLIAHPRQNIVYGDIEIDNEFLGSVKERGIIQPIIITRTELFDPEDFESYTIISGHRRVKAAEMAGMEFAPCIERTYDSILFANFDLIVANRQRVKSDMTIDREISEYKQFLSQIGKLKRSNQLSEAGEDLKQFISNIEKTWEEFEHSPLDTVQIIADKLDIPTGEVSKRIAISNRQYRDQLYNKLSAAGVGHKIINKIDEEWDKAKEALYRGEISLNEAYKAVIDFKKHLKSKIEKTEAPPKPKPKPPTKPAPAKTPVTEFACTLESIGIYTVPITALNDDLQARLHEHPISMDHSTLYFYDKDVNDTFAFEFPLVQLHDFLTPIAKDCYADSNRHS